MTCSNFKCENELKSNHVHHNKIVFEQNRISMLCNAKLWTNKVILMYMVFVISMLMRVALGQALLNTELIKGNNNDWNAHESIFRTAAALQAHFSNDSQTFQPAVIKIAPKSLTTKRSTSEQNASNFSLTTISPPLLTTLRYPEKFPHKQQINLHHRNYELDLERDHALPTSAPNADILKSNSNPSYPNPNRHHNHDRERHRHLLNSTPAITDMATFFRKNHSGQVQQQQPQPVHNDMPSYSPPARAFFTPPLPPEYQNPFADKPTLRGTNSEGGGGLIATNNGGGSGSGSYTNRRPIPPPSLMPGHERIPLRPPEATNMNTINESESNKNSNSLNPINVNDFRNGDPDRNVETSEAIFDVGHNNNNNNNNNSNKEKETQQEILPSIRRILSGSKGNKGDIPEVLLKQVTVRPTLILQQHQPPSPPVVLLNNNSLGGSNNDAVNNATSSSNINHRKSESSLDEKMSQNEYSSWGAGIITNSATMVAASSAATATSSNVNTTNGFERELMLVTSTLNNNTRNRVSTTSTSTSTSTSTATSTSSSSASPTTAASSYSTWTIAWNIHVYLSVTFFTILAVYSFYKLLTYNKLTHLFPQSYFLCIHIVLISICTTRIFYLCYDAYNINSSFHLFISEMLLNLPGTLLTISFSVLMLFLFRKSLSHKHNRYSALIRPLTVIVGCGVHVVLCITLHYVESYTMHNYYQQQQMQYNQQQQLLLQQQLQRQRQQQKQLERLYGSSNGMAATIVAESSSIDAQNTEQQHQQQQHLLGVGQTIATTLPPPRVLSLICQIIYIFVCISMGLLYLYLYRILKRILRSKSQNYIHGYQNLSYAIHITIATALLFVLLATLQIFGAIGISSKRSPLTISQSSSSSSSSSIIEIDWLQWGYQFSLRLIEIAIITLISWVTGLKTKSSNSSMPTVNGGAAMMVGNVVPLRNGTTAQHFVGSSSSSSLRGKVNTQRNHHHNHAGFFLPCTSTSSQEQFENDYPVVCSANTNLHTYTMRTGKLIYDDSFALSKLTQPSKHPSNKSYHQQQQQRPYETNSLRSASGNRYNDHHHSRYPQQQQLQHLQYNTTTTDYLTDATTDHYENPNFDLQISSTSSNMKFPKTTTTTTNSSDNSTTTASSSSKSGGGGGGIASGGSSQQQILLLQNEGCYSEPNYDFCNFERPKFGNTNHHQSHQHQMPIKMPSLHNSEHRDSNSCASSSASSSNANFTTYSHGDRRSGKRYSIYNSFEATNSNRQQPHNAVRKSGTLNNIASEKYKGSQQTNTTTNTNTTQPHHIEICHSSATAGGGADCKLESILPYDRSNSCTPLKMHREFQGSDMDEDDEGGLKDDIKYSERIKSSSHPTAYQ